jgi:hypothetical protein
MDELEDALGLGEILESVLAEVAQAGVRGQAGPCLLAGQLRQQDLASMCCRHDPSSPIHRRAEEVAGSPLRLSDVNSHAHAQRPGLTPGFVTQGELGLEAGVRAVRRRREDGHEPVTGDLENASAGVLHGAAKDCVVTLHGVVHRVGQRLPEPGAGLEIREHEGDGLRRVFAAHRGRV